MKASEYSEYIGRLSKLDKLYFYEALAHNLTISVRESWSTTEHDEQEKLIQIRYINEIQHRVTSKIHVERLELHEWTEIDFIKMISSYVKKCPTITATTANAITNAYSSTIKNGLTS